MHREAPVGPGERLAKHGPVGGEVVLGEDAAAGLHGACDRRADVSRVRHLGPFGGDASQGHREVALHQPPAGTRRLASGGNWMRAVPGKCWGIPRAAIARSIPVW